MPFRCPKAPDSGPPPVVLTTILPAGSTLVRCHGGSFAANSFNPNSGKDWTVPEDGARFNPFPDSHSRYVPHLYAADNFTAAALESVFHAVQHPLTGLPSEPTQGVVLQRDGAEEGPDHIGAYKPESSATERSRTVHVSGRR